MSSDSLAILRRNVGAHYGALAEEHYKHDLNEQDRSNLESAVKKLSTWTTVGSVAGVGLGLFLAARLRTTRKKMFEAFRAQEKPTHVQFAGGRTEPIPDVTPLLKPSMLGDFATYSFFAAGGLFFGGELGLLGGSLSAKKTITSDPASQKRIEDAFRRFRAEVLREEAKRLESQTSDTGLLEKVGLDGFV